MPQTIRIKPETRRMLETLAKSEGTPMTKMLDKVADAYRRQKFIENANAAYAAPRENPKAWRAEQEERRQWEATLADDLKDKRP